MLFHTFSSQAARRAFGGSDFLELQYCTLPQGTEVDKIVSNDFISHWDLRSLYVFGDDMELFYAHYAAIFSSGIYNNGERGAVDLLGVNYYSPEERKGIIEKIKQNQPPGHEALLSWLHGGENSNGFYILGL